MRGRPSWQTLLLLFLAGWTASGLKIELDVDSRLRVVEEWIREQDGAASVAEAAEAREAAADTSAGRGASRD